MKKTGVTFTEILIVIAVIALCASLLLPVLAAAKRKAKEAPCTSNLRQFYTAWALYVNDHDQVVPKGIPEFVDRQNASILECLSDNYSPGANERVSANMLKRVSLFYMDGLDEFRKDLEEADPNHGIAFCVVHGTTVRKVADPILATRGLVLRLLRDASIHHAQVGAMCSEASSVCRLGG